MKEGSGVLRGDETFPLLYIFLLRELRTSRHHHHHPHPHPTTITTIIVIISGGHLNPNNKSAASGVSRRSEPRCSTEAAS